MKKIVILQPIAIEGIRMLEQQNYRIEQLNTKDKTQIMKECADAEGLIVRDALLDAEFINNCQRLKVISRHGVGIENIDITAATEIGIQVTNTPLANCTSVAEHTLMLVLSLAKQINKLYSAVNDGNFHLRHRYFGMELSGKILLIIGFGKIGKIVAEMAANGFNMKIVVYDPFIAERETDRQIKIVSNLEDGLRVADFISLHVPLNDSTCGIIGQKELKAMKTSAFLINCGRSLLVDEDALAAELRSDGIAGAAIDVFKTDPPNTTCPLLHLNNVILTPHTAAHTQEAMKRMSVHAAQGIIEVLEQKKVSWPVNFIKTGN